MVAGVDRQNENEMANEQVEHVMSNELVVCNEQVADELATEEMEDRMASERVEDMMTSEGVEDSQKLEDEVTSEEVKDEMGEMEDTDSFIEDKVAVNVDFHGNINHKVGETHSRNLSLSVRQNIISTFQDTHIAPSKEYCRRLMSLDNEQFVSGNRDGVGCSTSVLQKISSQARLQLEEDKDLITSLLVLQKMFLNSMPSVNIMRPDSPVRGFIQHIHAYPFGVICFNEVAVRLYHDLAPKSPIFCDATGTIIALPKEQGKLPTVYYYALVLKHPISGRSPIPVAELITSDHTVLSISFFLEAFRRAEGLLFGTGNLIRPLQVIIDRSIVLLLSFLHTFNNETLHEYLHRSFRVVTGTSTSKDERKIFPHACLSHVMNSAKKECKKWFHKGQYKFAMYSFSTLVNATTLQELEMRLTLMKVLYCNKTNTDGVKKAHDGIVDVINSLGMVSQPESEVSSTSLTYECIEGSGTLTESMQPFGTYIRLKLDKIQVSNLGESSNAFYQPQWFDVVLNKWLPMAPFWTSLLLAMKIEYLSHIQKAFVDLMECIEVKSDNPSDPSRLATLLTMNAAYLRMGCQNDCCEGFTALFDQLMTGSKDHNEEVKLPQAERTICAKQDQESNAGSLGCDIDAADDEDDSYAEAENDTDCNSDTDGDHNAGVPQDFLVPDFRNAPDPDDIFALRWGKSLYMKNFPHFKRKTLE
ncbi:hypothetical protein EMCRGX_G009777 [Ephydatia muelleri]